MGVETDRSGCEPSASIGAGAHPSTADDRNGRRLDGLIGMLSHDLRTPLSAISGWLFLLESGKLDAEGQRRALAKIRASVDEQVRLIDDTLAISRSATGRLEVESAPFDVGELLAAVVVAARPDANAKGVSLDSEALAGVVSLTPSLRALERAYDAAKYGGVSDEPHVEINVPTLRWPKLARDGKHVLVARVHYVPYELSDGERASSLEDAATKAIARALPGFEALVRYQVTLRPKDLEARFGVTDGASTHGELTLDQILFMRPIAGYGRHAMPIDGLYLGGRGAHPGQRRRPSTSSSAGRVPSHRS